MGSPTAHEDKPSAQTLRRGLSILKLLAQVPGGLGVTEIARRLKLSKATTVRLTRALMDEQFVVQDTNAARLYRLGPESFAVGLAAEPNYALQRLAAPSLRTMAIETGDWIFFTVRQDLEAICLSRESVDTHYPKASLRVGDRHPLGLGAGGMAILAAMPQAEAEAVLATNTQAIIQRYPHMTPEHLRALLSETRERGYSYIPGTISPGYWGIGVPVYGPHGDPIAAIILVASTNRLSGARKEMLANRLKRLSQNLLMAPSE